MTNTMKLKNKKGFTLTELIVVIVIIGILAAVLIPSLTGYITKANKSAAEQEASEFVTVYNAFLVEREAGTLDDSISSFAEYVDDIYEGVTLNGSVAETPDSNTSSSTSTGFIYTQTAGKYKVTYTKSTGELKVEEKTASTAS